MTACPHSQVAAPKLKRLQPARHWRGQNPMKALASTDGRGFRLSHLFSHTISTRQLSFLQTAPQGRVCFVILAGLFCLAAHSRPRPPRVD
jgi:hypothetical protein